MIRRPAASLLLPFFLLTIAAKTADADWFDNIEISGTVETEWAVTTDQGDSQKLETIVQPEFSTDISGDTSFTAILRVRGDANDNLEPKMREENSSSPASRRWLIGNDIDAELRELYLDTYIEGTSLRVGKQQVVWGQADGLKVLDVVNPQSMREFILDDFDDSRIPLWTVNAEFPVGDESSLQMLWLPDTTYQDLPERDGSFAFTSSRLVPQAASGMSVVINEEDRPTNMLTDSDTGTRFATFMEGWDITLNYLYHYNDNPVLYRTIDTTNNSVTINPEYERTHLMGGTLSNAFGDFIFRSELGYSTNSYHVTQNTSDVDGIEESGEASYVLGLDYSGFTDTFLSAQFFQSILTEDHEGVTRDQVENSITFLAERSFANETWKVETLFLHSLNDNDGLIRPKLSYELASNIDVWLGADVFYGQSDGIFGQFKDEDRITFGFQWGF